MYAPVHTQWAAPIHDVREAQNHDCGPGLALVWSRDDVRRFRLTLATDITVDSFVAASRCQLTLALCRLTPGLDLFMNLC